MSDITFANYVVAWVDLLGQTSLLEKIGPIPFNEEEMASFVKPLKPTFGRVRKFRELITHFREQLTQKTNIPENLIMTRSADELAMCEKYTQPKVNVAFLADSAMLSVCLREDMPFSPIRGIDCMLDMLSLIMISCLAAHAPIRGAVDVGVCAEIDGGELYGQAVSRANYRERRQAGYPRIIIGDYLVHYLKTCEDVINEPPITPEKKIQKGWLSQIANKFETDTDGRIILSYLCSKRDFPNKEDFNFLTQEACKLIKNTISDAISRGDVKLAGRYSVLKNYFERHNCWL